MAERRGLTQMTQFPRTFGAGFQPAAVAGGDPDFASVVLLLDFAGVDGATDITDLSNSAHVDTFLGNAQVDTANQFLGENSVLFGATTDELTFPDSVDWDFGTGDFTIEFGFRSTGPIAFDGLIASSTVATGWYIHSSATTLRFTNNNIIVTEQTHGMSADTFHHVAVTRSGDDFRIFVDGVQIGSTVTDTVTVNGGSGPLFLGALESSANPFGGALGAVRITKGVARYTANFTPLTEFYPTS